MRRRGFISLFGGAAAWPLVARAEQSSSKVWRVAYLYPGFLDNPADHAIFDVFRAEMRELGYIEGKNLIIDTGTAEGKAADANRYQKISKVHCANWQTGGPM
jgi:putative ABC transport system substrate-binding protein